MTDIQILIVVVSLVCLFVVGVPLIFGIVLPVIKPNIKSNTNRYLYAFSSGFFLMMATVLFIGESRAHINEFIFHSFSFNEEISNFIGALIVSGTLLIGLFLSLGFKYLFARSKSFSNKNSFDSSHDHNYMIFNVNDYNPKSKAFAIFFLLTHRIPDGIIIGLLCSQIAKEGINIVNIIFLCSFIVHIIPEELIIYYRQIKIGISKKKATINSLIAVCIIIPIIVGGSIIGWFSIENEMAIHVIQLLAASFLLFISIVEFIPEFLHNTKMDGKQWYITILIFIIGIVIGLFVLSFHNHEFHNHEHYKNIFW